MGSLTVSNLVVLIIYLIAMVAIGIYCRRYSGKLEGFFVGFRNLGPWLLAFTYFATYYSSSVLIGNSGVGYKAGLSWFFMPIAQILLIPIGLLLFAKALMNASRQLGVITIPDYFRTRYKSTLPSGILAVIMVIFLVPYMIAVTKGGALAFETLLGVPYAWAVVIIIVITAGYSVVGGFMSGVITDMIQGIIMIFGGTILFIVVLVAAGGPAGVAVKLQAVDPLLVQTPGTLGWAGLLGFAFVFGIAPWGLPQLLQKTLAMKSRKVVGPAAIVILATALLILYTSNGSGIIARALFGNEFIKNPDYAFPTLISRYLPPLAGAILLTAIVAAVMSTLDAILLVAAGAVSRDIYQQIINKNASDKSVLKLTWIIMLILSVITMIFAFSPPPMLLYLTAFSFSLMTATILAPMFFGIYYRKATLAGCVVSQIMGVAVVLILTIFKIKFLIHPLIPGLITALIVLPIVSNFTKKLPDDFVNRIFSEEYKKD